MHCCPSFLALLTVLAILVHKPAEILLCCSQIDAPRLTKPRGEQQLCWTCSSLLILGPGIQGGQLRCFGRSARDVEVCVGCGVPPGDCDRVPVDAGQPVHQPGRRAAEAGWHRQEPVHPVSPPPPPPPPAPRFSLSSGLHSAVQKPGGHSACRVVAVDCKPRSCVVCMCGYMALARFIQIRLSCY